MATVPPPPSKRQKLEAATQAERQYVPPRLPNTDMGSVRLQYVTYQSNEPRTASILVPIHQVTEKNLHALFKDLLPEDDREDLLHGRLQTSDGVDIETYRKRLVTEYERGETRDTTSTDIKSEPQAVFRVRQPTRCAANVRGIGNEILSLSFSPAQSNRMVTGVAGSIAKIIDCDTGTIAFRLVGHTGNVLVTTYSPDGEIIATGSLDKTVRLWGADSGVSLGGPLKGHTKRVRDIAWEPQHLQEPGRPRLASASEDCTVRVWDVVGRKVEFVIGGHEGGIPCVKWGGTGLIYSASKDRTVKIWSSVDGRLLATLKGHTGWVNHLALSTEHAISNGSLNDGVKRIERLVSASDDATLFLWEPYQEGLTSSISSNVLHIKPTVRLTGHQNVINRVAFSPNGKYIVSASFDKSLRLWAADTGSFIRKFLGHVAPVYCCCFSPDSRFVASGSADSTVKIWAVDSDKLQKDLYGHQDAVFALSWASHGGMIGSGGKDKIVKIWRH